MTPTPVCIGHNPRNAHQHRHFGEGPKVFHLVECRIPLLSQQHRTSGQSSGQNGPNQDQLEAVRCSGRFGGNGRIQDAELLAFLALLHVPRELGIFVPLEQRVVEILRHLVVPLQLLKLLLMLRRLFDPPLVGGEVLPQALFFGLHGLKFSVYVSEDLLQLGGRSNQRRHLRRIQLGLSRQLGEFVLEGGDLPFQPDHVRVLLAGARAEFGQLHPRPLESPGKRIGAGGSGSSRAAHACLDQLLRQLVPTFHDSNLILAVQVKIRIEPLERRQVGLHLFRQLAHVPVLELAEPPFLFLLSPFHLLQLGFEEHDRLGGLASAHLHVCLDVHRSQ